MTTMHRTSNDAGVWAPLLAAIVVAIAILMGGVSGIEVPTPALGFELPAGVPEQVSAGVPAYAQEMAVYGETGAVTVDLMPVYMVEEQVAGR